ncbi:DUF7828 domain-containing protein [Pectobacterium carotovorum]|uniref:DUF7828 domain-containing protein n=1 Tax=Pectobacterium carotovorum TaxID=554 RepID=UPI003826CFEE
MRIEKCHIAQRNTGEIVAARQVDSADDEWRCHHCQCPLVFHPATVISPAWFEHVITAGNPETHYIALTLSQRIKRPPI